jgi:uncharacterized cupredoxin-like copper-binding protein
VDPGQTVEVTIPADAAPGEYKFYCSVPGHEAAGMAGTLVVEEGGAAAPAGGEEPSQEEASPAAGGNGVGPLIAVDIGWELGDLSTMLGDAITLTVSPGTTFDVISEGIVEHDFVVDELELAVAVAPGETVQVTIPNRAQPGTYEFYCSIPGHVTVGMVGTLVVEAGDGEAAAAQATPAGEAGAAATPEAEAAAGGEAVGPLEAIDIGWKLGDLSTLAGDAITLTVSPGTTFEMPNTGAAEHDFTVDELSVHVVAAPGETVEVTIPEDAAPGEYKFYCSVPGHEAAGMAGTLVVQ